ncbi:MAG: glutamine-hydrolyzing carbamoyl-phosphate synthase small subunit, partial [Caulobacteraceae bacterium]
MTRAPDHPPLPAGTTAVLALADGTVWPGIGHGATGQALGEVCFNTAMTGHQEILTDPSYLGQIVAFTFPHVGNVGANPEDIEQLESGAAITAVGAVFRAAPTPPANWRAAETFDAWLVRRGVVGLSGIDTRALTIAIRERGMPHGVIAHAPNSEFDLEALLERARGWNGLLGADLATTAGGAATSAWSEGVWSWPAGYAGRGENKYRVVLVDYGAKRNIARALVAIGAGVTIVPATTSAEAILEKDPDGVVLSNGPGDPAATARHAGRHVRALAESGTPLMGVCLGHQLLALAMGGATTKMDQGHHGANHPVKDLATGKIEIVSMNHGFTVDRDRLPAGLKETHVSLFDGSNAGLALEGRPVF